KLGLDLKKSEFVNVAINLGGSISSPQVKYQLTGGDGSQSLTDAAKETVKAEIEKQKEKLQNEIKSRTDTAKAIVQSKVDAAVDSAKIAAQKELDKAKDKAVGAIKDQIGAKADTTAQKLLDGALKDTGTKTTDEIKDQLEKFNPFKKKKKTDKEGGGG